MARKNCFLSLIGIVLLTGCNNVDHISSSFTSETKEQSGFIKKDTTIRVLTMITENNANVFKRLVQSFNEVEPNVHIHPIYMNGSANYDSLQRSVIAGFFKNDYPDIAQCYPDHILNYFKFGKVINMDSYLTHPEYGLTEEDKADYIAQFMKEGQRFETEGTYSLPFNKSTEIMYYNKNLVLHAPLSSELLRKYPKLPQDITEEYIDNITWEDFFTQLAPALKEHYSQKEFECILSYKSTDNFFVTLATEYGGYTSVEDGKGVVKFNNPTTREWVKNLRHYKEEKLFGTEKISLKAKSSFRNGTSLFSITSNASYASNAPKNITDFEVGVCRIPHAEGQEHKAISQGTPLCFFDHGDKNRALASYLFWKHITNKKNSLLWSSNSAYMGIRNSNYEIDELPIIDEIAALNTPSQLNVYKTQWKIYKSVASEMFQTEVFRGSSTCRTKAGELFLQCLSSEEEPDIEALFDETEREIEPYLVSQTQEK